MEVHEKAKQKGRQTENKLRYASMRSGWACNATAIYKVQYKDAILEWNSAEKLPTMYPRYRRILVIVGINGPEPVCSKEHLSPRANGVLDQVNVTFSTEKDLIRFDTIIHAETVEGSTAIRIQPSA